MNGCKLTVPVDTPSLAGQIKYCPKKEDILEKTPELLPSGLNGDVLGHPVLIISREVGKDGKVIIFPMTSFQNHDISDKYPWPRQRRNREKYWPIKPTPPHPDTGKFLQLKDGRDMDRKYSYVDSKTSYPIPYKILDRYDGPGPEEDWVLDDESFNQVTKGRDYARFHGSSWRQDNETHPPEPVIEKTEAVKMRRDSCSIPKENIQDPVNLAQENECRAWREAYEELKDFLPWTEGSFFHFQGWNEADP